MNNEFNDDSLAEILSALRHNDDGVREQAIQRLQRYVNNAGAVAGKNLDTRAELDAWDKACKQTLLRPEIVDALLTAIDDASSRVRATAALMLGSAEVPVAQVALIRRLRIDTVNHVRMMCVVSVRRDSSLQSVDAFIAALRDPHYQVVFPACQALRDIKDRRAVGPLRAVMKHESWQVRFTACEALVSLDAVDDQVIHTLEALSAQPEAAEHDQMVLSVRELSAELEPDSADEDEPPQTMAVVLARARQLLQENGEAAP